MSPSPDMVRYDIILSGQGNPLAPPLCMEICRIIRDTVVKAIINLVEKCRDWVGMLVYKDNPRPCTEGHLEVAVKPPGRSHRHRDRVHPIIRPKTTAEKITWGGQANTTLKSNGFLATKANGTYTITFNCTCLGGAIVGGIPTDVGSKTYSSPYITVYWDDSF